MTMRCKAGGIALVIYDEPQCVTNIGRIVEVRGPVSINSELELPCWLIKPVHRQLWKIVESTGRICTEIVTWESRVEHPDAWLLPLRPEPPDSAWWEIQEEMDEWLLSEHCVEDLKFIGFERGLKS